MVASRRLEGLALATPLSAPCHEPPLLDPAMSFLGVLAVDGHIVGDPTLGRAPGVSEDAPGVGSPDTADEGIEKDGLVAREVRVQQEELRCVGEEADEEDNPRDSQAGESWVEHCCGGGGERREKKKRRRRRALAIMGRVTAGAGHGLSLAHQHQIEGFTKKHAGIMTEARYYTRILEIVY